jgi:hypothetical protein
MKNRDTRQGTGHWGLSSAYTVPRLPPGQFHLARESTRDRRFANTSMNAALSEKCLVKKGGFLTQSRFGPRHRQRENTIFRSQHHFCARHRLMLSELTSTFPTGRTAHSWPSILAGPPLWSMTICISGEERHASPRTLCICLPVHLRDKRKAPLIGQPQLFFPHPLHTCPELVPQIIHPLLFDYVPPRDNRANCVICPLHLDAQREVHLKQPLLRRPEHNFLTRHQMIQESTCAILLMIREDEVRRQSCQLRPSTIQDEDFLAEDKAG